MILEKLIGQLIYKIGNTGKKDGDDKATTTDANKVDPKNNIKKGDHNE